MAKEKRQTKKSYILIDIGAVFPGATGHGLSEGIGIHVTVIRVEESE